MTDGATADGPGCLVILVQASAGMAAPADTAHGPMPKAEFLRFGADYLLDALAAAPLPHPLDVAVVGYRAGADGGPAVVPLLPTAGPAGFARPDDPAAAPGDAAAKGAPRPWTADPGAAGDPAPAAGLAEAYRLVAGWLAGRPDARPPVVVHCTDGAGVGEEYERVAASLGMLRAAGDPPRLVHWAVAAEEGGPPAEAWKLLRRLSARVAVAGPDGGEPVARPAMGVNECPLAETWAALFDPPAAAEPDPAAGTFEVVRALTTPKHGNSDAEWEDGYAIEPDAGAAAVTDGASEGIFCRIWAGILARRFVADPPNFSDPVAVAKWVGGCRAAWRQDINYAGLRSTQQNKVSETGAAATLVGLRIGAVGPDGSAGWRATAVGDACLYWVRDGRLVGTFPLAAHGHLDSTPALLRTKPGPPAGPLAGGGTCRPGDLFLLATDAVAGALFRAAAEGPVEWARYAALDDEPWRAEVADLRAAGRMVNDDCTLVVLRVTAGRPAGPPADEPSPDEPSTADARDGAATPESAPQPDETP